jgi:arsenite-transporting ATPase
LLSRRLIFFGGKGGVGKTTLASATALALAGRRLRTLLVSIDPAHSTSDILRSELGPEPRPVVGDCWAMELDPDREADRFIADVKDRIAETVAPRLKAEVERQIDIARASPGATEAALFERFTRILEEEGREFERVVFDTAPTGQTLQLLSLPEQMSAWITGLIGRRRKVTAVGRMWRNVAGAAAEEASDDDPVLQALEERRARFLRARGVLTDSAQTAFAFVVLPERLPIWETERAVRALVKHGIPVAGILVNQVLPDDLVGDFLDRRKARQAEYLAKIHADFGEWPLWRVPMREQDPVGTDVIRELGNSLWGAYGLLPQTAHETAIEMNRADTESQA